MLQEAANMETDLGQECNALTDFRFLLEVKPRKDVKFSTMAKFPVHMIVL